jgi:DNA-binding CsgD family transcriptional regulator
VLLDRRTECQVFAGLTAAVRAGESRALVLRGEPGIGKTALLEYLVGQVPDCRVARAAGVESEMELAFAGLHQLCAPLLDRLDHLPGSQRDALRTAFGLSTGGRPDRLVVGLAALSLLGEIARERPLICLVDDTQWLDRASAQTLAFVARRLRAESVAMVLAVRDSPDGQELAGLTELVVTGLPHEDARALLVSAHRGPVDARVIDRLVAETRGNPLALLELPRWLTPAELTGGFGPPGPAALPDRIEEVFQRQLTPLEPETRRLLLIAAAEPIGDPVLMWRAADKLGVGADIAAQAAGTGLVEFGVRVKFRHPLVRSAIYRAASAEERRSAHRALAEATYPEADPERRAWHRAQATVGPDEGVAADLERSAGRAQARGGLAAAAAFLERATELTPDPVRRVGRALAAAHAMQLAGASEAAIRLLSVAEAGPADTLQRARANLLRAQIELSVRRGRVATQLLLEAARQLELLDVRLARETYLQALFAAMFAGPLAGGGGVREAAEAARAAPVAPHPPHPADLLLDGLAIRFTEGYAAGVPTLRRALAEFRSQGDSGLDGLRWLWHAHVTAGDLWEDEIWDVLTARHVQLARDAGALSELHLALTSRIGVDVLTGELTRAAWLVEELDTVIEATGSRRAPYGSLLLAAWQGREDKVAELTETTTQDVLARGEGIGLTVAGWAQAVLYNSLGRYHDALTVALRATDHLEEMGASTWGALVEVIEAAARGGQPERAVDAYQRLSDSARASGTEWALGIGALSLAVLNQGETADRAYREALERLGRTRIRGHLARAHLLYGEWLRRQNRRIDAREQLRFAHEMFTAMGMKAFAQRAAQELLATGETARKRNVTTVTELTAQEAHIARLVREGLSNPEIASRLFISPRTVEWHLHHIFEKLHITSRRQLRH